ncbi:helix-turn-helix transcriptional regulator [Actinoplanes sp. TRM 88003]|uniref:Helix-turn-helix transcriptional regulator n=2 Tax=Paractinoplanes aksuensis TaxID=2939490 RepID=A0ABT1E3Q3_9ACTN|nr:helix-turn-helix transcriptional regulator [Actinoplanes aksuensis]
MLSALTYTEAVLADDGDAEQRYLTSLAALPTAAVLLRARLHLHHGRWLRRRRRYVDAREPLRIARDEFEHCGAAPWAEAAREQLRASGAATSRRPVATESLSAQELQVAVLAAQGLSNREIGQRLFISPRTVSSHLYRVFPRLGVTSRGQLATALAAAAPPLEQVPAMR